MKAAILALSAALLIGCQAGSTPGAGDSSGTAAEGLPDDAKRKPGEDVPPL